MAENRWHDAMRLWLATAARRSAHTARAYRKALADFGAFVNKPLAEVGGADAQAWANHLAGSGLADATVNARLAALSSFYRFCMTRYTFAENGRERPLAIFNPFDQVNRQRVELYGKSRPLSLEQVHDLLASIDRATPRGARDYALIYFMLLTGRRNAEVRGLHWGDIYYAADGRLRYHWRGKGGKGRVDDLPPPAYEAIRIYLDQAGRLAEIRPGDFVFCAENGDGSQPLTGRHLNRIIKQRAAEIGAEWTTAHTLRHTAAALRRAGGEDLQTVSSLLAHSSLRVTQVYLEALEGHRDSGWRQAATLIAPPCASHSSSKQSSTGLQPAKDDSAFSAGGRPGLPGAEGENGRAFLSAEPGRDGPGASPPGGWAARADVR